jgi:hypothetical protein
MGQVNGRREREALESDFEPPAPVQGAQPSTKNGRIPGLFGADQQTERLSAWAMLADVRPPQVGVRRGPGASISESAWSPIERARPVTAEGSSMSPLPRVPAGRFRRSRTRDLAEAAERLFCGLWSRGNPGRRSDAGRGASGGAGVKAGEAPGLAGPGLDARASRCGTVIIGSMPRSDLLRPRHRLAHQARAANGSQCRPATSGA